jgi:hypothetical protein
VQNDRSEIAKFFFDPSSLSIILTQDDDGQLHMELALQPALQTTVANSILSFNTGTPITTTIPTFSAIK